ncbi:MAG TPA: hypothetical protein VFU31_26110, partial [Candidatus Binatia bacterium]|nr:hypothetical protein [Candidatus Binatia bacterium]
MHGKISVWLLATVLLATASPAEAQQPGRGVAVLFNPTNVGSPYALKETEAAAQSLALQLQILEARSTEELTSA